MSPEKKLADRRPSQTKIVATVGPASADVDDLTGLIDAGVDVFRVNTAHGSREEHQQRVDDIREASRRSGNPVAILVDLAGPKIRLGELRGDELECLPGERIQFVRGDVSDDPVRLVTTYGPLIDELNAGDRVMLADGTVSLIVEQVDDNAATCRIVQGGTVRSRQGVNLPGVKLSVPCLTERDRDNAAWAAQSGIDFVGLSFVRSANDVHELKAIVGTDESAPWVIAKIEKPEALDDLDAIVDAADGIMVARGDLGVEIDIAEVAVVQKRIVATCRDARKPVIIATQMLDSMQRSRLPTRAEVTDVANAVLDGADACMLSGETAVGQYPRECVEMMHRIALATESVGRHQQLRNADNSHRAGGNAVNEATARAAGLIAEQLNARMIVVASALGETALIVSKNRHFIPTIGASNSETTLRRMCLFWGIIPLPAVPAEDNDELLDHVVRWSRSLNDINAGDRIVLISGTGINPGHHNMIVVHEIE